MTRSFRSIHEPDLLVDLPEGWLVALPEWAPCDRHGHGLWWEHARTGDLHCVACWPDPGPPRAWLKNLWESCDGSLLTARGFVAGQVVVYCKTTRDRPWPWANGAGAPAPAEEPF